MAEDCAMIGAAATTTLAEPVRAKPRNLVRWLAITVAALAMVATLPGRTHGLGLITEPVLADLRIGRVTFAATNLWATLLGATFCLPIGWLQDRVGSRVVLLGVTLGLVGSVLGMIGVR